MGDDDGFQKRRHYRQETHPGLPRKSEWKTARPRLISCLLCPTLRLDRCCRACQDLEQLAHRALSLQDEPTRDSMHVSAHEYSFVSCLCCTFKEQQSRIRHLEMLCQQQANELARERQRLVDVERTCVSLEDQVDALSKNRRTRQQPRSLDSSQDSSHARRNSLDGQDSDDDEDGDGDGDSGDEQADMSHDMSHNTSHYHEAGFIDEELFDDEFWSFGQPHDPENPPARLYERRYSREVAQLLQTRDERLRLESQVYELQQALRFREEQLNEAKALREATADPVHRHSASVSEGSSALQSPGPLEPGAISPLGPVSLADELLAAAREAVAADRVAPPTTPVLPPPAHGAPTVALSDHAHPTMPGKEDSNRDEDDLFHDCESELDPALALAHKIETSITVKAILGFLAGGARSREQIEEYLVAPLRLAGSDKREALTRLRILLADLESSDRLLIFIRDETLMFARR
ncbi:uncharacterized protein MONBRDRAFT_9229 [Monosiga brevicollis MX1]|uniref:Uncharacterized protein n=1 Tax=Monosiga brevicollis TaxID=81824 RepID=A9V2H4_MONBE|nr:uncharacterized protein MONBRDRAFT_9229 [Monosiga brevicollis MX1]EDQ88257.1 predicted protein [Monosiga brevicollis MX1]|eukprot:XP_001746850.1 hypothetical protein [Monosiga brevicollis MX1]